MKLVPSRKQMDAIYDKIRSHVEEHGRTVVGVAPGGAKLPAFSYTVGNALKELPELLVVGATDTYSLNKLSELMVERGRKFDDGEVVDLGGAYPVKVVDAGGRVRDDWTIQAGQWLGRQDYAVQQVLIPDLDGRFPGEPGCREPYASVPVLRPGP